jgi:ubiquinone/menaquinone biosynthesis C-methylase UbiE
MEYYNQIAKSYNELHGEEQKKKFKLIEKELVGEVLDVGCGTGVASKGVGVDPSIELLKLNKNECVCGRAEQLPFKDNSFDTVISLTAVHHFELRALDEIKRVAKKKVIISVLKSANNCEEIIKEIKNRFNVQKQIKEEKDIIFICML